MNQELANKTLLGICHSKCRLNGVQYVLKEYDQEGNEIKTDKDMTTGCCRICGNPLTEELILTALLDKQLRG